jgi:hypothetical protein
MHCGFSQPHPAVHPPRAALDTRAAVAAGVRHSLSHWFPDNFHALCHAFAVVGSNVASIALGRNYRPVAGLAAIDTGAGQLIVMAQENAFDCAEGGAYHCWIESADDAPRQLIDLTFEHNHLYAQANGYAWQGGPAASYLWGAFDELTIQTPLESLRPGFGKDKIWLQETPKGTQWMERHVADNANAYVELTAHAMRHYQSLMA